MRRVAVGLLPSKMGALVVLGCDGLLGAGVEQRHCFHLRAMVPHSRSLSWKGEAAAKLKIPDFSFPRLWSNSSFVFDPSSDPQAAVWSPSCLASGQPSQVSHVVASAG